MRSELTFYVEKEEKGIKTIRDRKRRRKWEMKLGSY